MQATLLKTANLQQQQTFEESQLALEWSKQTCKSSPDSPKEGLGASSPKPEMMQSSYDTSGPQIQFVLPSCSNISVDELTLFGPGFVSIGLLAYREQGVTCTIGIMSPGIPSESHPSERLVITKHYKCLVLSRLSSHLPGTRRYLPPAASLAAAVSAHFTGSSPP